jgi:hypothetical protein
MVMSLFALPGGGTTRDKKFGEISCVGEAEESTDNSNTHEKS